MSWKLGCDHPGVALARVHPALGGLADRAQVVLQELGGDDGDLLVVATLDDEQRRRGLLLERRRGRWP